MDERLTRLSYSSVLLLNGCPRKYELTKLSSGVDVDEEDIILEDLEEIPDKALTPFESLTFSFGHFVGWGIQELLKGRSIEDVIYFGFIQWSEPLDSYNPKQKKSFYHAVWALKKFHAQKADFLQKYELLSPDSCELSFRITLPSHTYRGFFDAILKEPSGKISILEIKTSSANTISGALYQNSAQALGYSIVLDQMAPNLSKYDVTYLVYATKSCDWHVFSFAKSYTGRSRWIHELLLTCEETERYEEVGVWPMRGNHCVSFNRECKFLGLCHMDNSKLVSQNKIPVPEPIGTYRVEVTLEDLIKTQMEITS